MKEFIQKSKIVGVMLYSWLYAEIPVVIKDEAESALPFRRYDAFDSSSAFAESIR